MAGYKASIETGVPQANERHGAKLGRPNGKHGVTALQKSTTKSCNKCFSILHLEVVVKELKKGDESKTRLHIAVAQGNMVEVEAMVAAGADVNLVTTFKGDQLTPLCCAALVGNLAAVKFLHDHCKSAAGHFNTHRFAISASSMSRNVMVMEYSKDTHLGLPSLTAINSGYSLKP